MAATDYLTMKRVRALDYTIPPICDADAADLIKRFLVCFPVQLDTGWLTIFTGTRPLWTPWGTTKVFSWRYSSAFFFRGRKNTFEEFTTECLVHHKLECTLDWPCSWNWSGSILFATSGNFSDRWSLGGLRRPSDWEWWVNSPIYNLFYLSDHRQPVRQYQLR